MEQVCRDRHNELTEEREQVSDLKSRLEERNIELDALRKRYHRDLPINGMDSTLASPVSSTPKHEMTAARDEITGLKYAFSLTELTIVYDSLHVGTSFKNYRRKRPWPPNAIESWNLRINCS